jgi:hypothetical protein
LKDRQDITGITYEPWHIRYVGKENAEYISKHDLTLEEDNVCKEKTKANPITKIPAKINGIDTLDFRFL